MPEYKNSRAKYGNGLLKYLSEKLTAEFGKEFTVANLRNMRQFYLAYPKRYTVCSVLSWSHYRVLMRLSATTRRAWYTEECAKSGWSVRQLERQINTMFYERLLSSKDQESVAAEIHKSTPTLEYEKIIRAPYVLEFLNLPANPNFYEKDLEQALIDHLQKFLLELGRGFSFVARQKKYHLTDVSFILFSYSTTIF